MERDGFGHPFFFALAWPGHPQPALRLARSDAHFRMTAMCVGWRE